ncbi:MAG: phenylalanine--tRNA ligase subunit alpha [Clostridia bacterium]
MSSEIESTNALAKLEEIRVSYLGKKGEVTALLKTMGTLSKEERPAFGECINSLRNEIESKLEAKKNILEEEALKVKLMEETIDITMDGENIAMGTKHPLTIVEDDLKNIFIGMGYQIAEGPEIETTFFNFDALNAPSDHPSRDIQDTMYITEDIILRSQTSPVQVRTMLENKPPIKIICPGRVYRSDNVDATHSPMFHQMEGLVVGKGVTMAHLKGALEEFAKTYFGEKTRIRLRPHHFPFTEPSAEVDVSCFVCGGVGCKVCKQEGWIEILGAGMVHPNVLRAGNIDPEEYTGFAFGMGIERIAMVKYGISDMRLLYENDTRFLKQF